MSDDHAESAVALLIAEGKDFAWIAFQRGQDELAESINRELCEARVQFADLIGVCD